MMIQTHSLRRQPAILRTIFWFVVMVAALCLFVGPVGILYALGFEALVALIYLLATAFAALLDPDIY
jgi:hypothetical protein